MNEYKPHLNFFKEYAHMHFSKHVEEADWGKTDIAEEYLEKYWLSADEYFAIWKPIQDQVFQDNSLPEMVFLPGFRLIALEGGCLFTEDDFVRLQKVMIELGEKHMIIIQHSQEFTSGEPMFRMKFPVDIAWDELMSGNYISAVLFEMTYNEYFVFGESGKWGKYSANDYDSPLDILGLKPELTQVFTASFQQPEEEKNQIKEMLPHSYRELMI
jgi:hypothetical protein